MIRGEGLSIQITCRSQVPGEFAKLAAPAPALLGWKALTGHAQSRAWSPRSHPNLMYILPMRWRARAGCVLGQGIQLFTDILAAQEEIPLIGVVFHGIVVLPVPACGVTNCCENTPLL